MIRQGKMFVCCIVLLMTFRTIVDIAHLSKNDNDIGRKPIVTKLLVNEPPITLSRHKLLSLNVSKWIVITTVAHPSEAIKALTAKEEWRIVVVADLDTPSDWLYKNCDFLSIEKQKQLGYAINSHLPFKSYTRKMIGYLYAIENGAEWIYDTDDDNQPIEKGLAQFDFKSGDVSGISFGKEMRKEQADYRERNLFNPYSFFGQPGMWPRGYPLENVKQENDNNSYVLCKEQKAPAIQQGLVRKDPDVDAIYRLLHADKKDGLEVNFNPHTPPIILNKGIYCPFNSQNTLFHRDAFWALFLPVSVAFRVTDIWRSYFAQKLLHLTDNRIGYYPTNAIQKRNAHSYLADFNDEMLFYSNAGRLVDFLTHWTCKNASLTKCIVELSDAFVHEKFWNVSDLDLAKAWIADLNSLEYKFPAIISSKMESAQAKDCRNVSLNFAAKVEKRLKQARKGFNALKDWCRLANSSFAGHCFDESKNFNDGVWGNLQKTALIIVNNFPFGPSISLLQRFYEPYFATVIFCGPIYLDRIHNSNVSADFLQVLPFNYINVSENEISRGFRAYICPTKTIEMRLQNIKGYLVIADDTIFNFWNEFDTSRFRIAAITKARYGIWWNHPWGIGIAAMNTSISLIKNRTAISPDSELNKELTAFSKAKGEDVFPILNELLWSISDFFFVPRACEALFYELSEIFFEAKLFHEIAIPSLAAVCGMDWRKLLAKDANNATQRDIDADKHKHLWGESWKNHYSNELIYLHPIKLSTVNKIEEKKNYCDGPIKLYAAALSHPVIIATTTSSTTTTSTSTTTTTSTTTSTEIAATTATIKVADSTSTTTTVIATTSSTSTISSETISAAAKSVTSELKQKEKEAKKS